MSWIYVLPVNETVCLLYAPLHHIKALVNQATVDWLRAHGGLLSPAAPVSSALQSLAQELQRAPAPLPTARSGAIQPIFLGILPTRACNLACQYCGFGASGASHGQMDRRLAVAAVDWLAHQSNASEQKMLNIHFFGGEPFWAREVVDVVVHYARSRAHELGLMTHFEVSTNGVFDERQAQFIGDYFDTVVLSLDAPRAAHDIHRPRRDGKGSFDAVTRTAQLLSPMPVELCVRLCVSQYNVGQLETTIPWLAETFRPSAIDVETLQRTPEAERAGLYPPNPYEFAINYVRAAQVARSSGYPMVFAAAVTETMRTTFCPVGQDAIIISPDGRVSACYLPQEVWQAQGLDLDIGWLTTSVGMQLDWAALTRVRQMVLRKPARCERCFCRWSCAGGCHVQHSYPGCVEEYDDFCIQTRLITLCGLLEDLDDEGLVQALLNDASALQHAALQHNDCLVQEPGNRS